jgi:CxxC motif-containing protein
VEKQVFTISQNRCSRSPEYAMVEQKQNDQVMRGSLLVSSTNFERTPALTRNENPAIEGGTYVNVSGS